MKSMFQQLYHPVLQDKVLLLIDDEPVNLGMLTAYLEEYQVEILVARDGKSGIDKVQHAHPDLILLDVMMPGIDGFETCRLLKTREETRDIPVIFMTSLTDIADKVRAFQVGAVDYITKPFQAEEVLARVHTHLSLHVMRRRLEEQNQRLQQEITERKRVEAELEKHRQRAENGLRVKTEELDRFFQRRP